mgnify:CR=1 FL=1
MNMRKEVKIGLAGIGALLILFFRNQLFKGNQPFQARKLLLHRL